MYPSNLDATASPSVARTREWACASPAPPVPIHTAGMPRSCCRNAPA